MQNFSVYEAKARFSEVIRRVRNGGTIIVTYRGMPVAELRPIGAGRADLEDRLDDLVARGLLRPSESDPGSSFQPLAFRPGALGRFLEARVE